MPVGTMLGSVVGGIGGPVLSGVNAALAICGSISASNSANLATMAASLTQGRAILAPALSFADSYLSALPVLGGVSAGTAPPVAAAGLATAATLAASLPALRQTDATLGTMLQIVSNAG
jgi:hypothetical protein